MGNLKVNGKAWSPLHSFRTDNWDWPESHDPAVSALSRGDSKQMKEEATERLEYRRIEEAKRAVQILESREVIGQSSAG